MDPIQPTSRARLWWQFLAGVFYLAVVAACLSGATRHHFLLMLLAVVGGAIFCSSLALLWLTLWALRKESRLGQFGLGSLFLLTLFVALYAGLVRWLAVAIGQDRAQTGGDGELFVQIAVVCLFPLLIAIPFVLGMTESLLWLAVWILRRRPIRRLLGRRRRRDS